MEVSGQLHAPAALPPVSPWYPLDRRLGGPQSCSGSAWSYICLREDTFVTFSLLKGTAHFSCALSLSRGTLRFILLCISKAEAERWCDFLMELQQKRWLQKYVSEVSPEELSPMSHIIRPLNIRTLWLDSCYQIHHTTQKLGIQI